MFNANLEIFSVTREPLLRGGKPVPVVPVLLEALELNGNVPFSVGTAMGAWESSGSFEDFFFLEFPRSLGLGNTKHVDKYVELPTKHEALLKPSQEERPKTSLTSISLIEKLEQSLDGLRKRVIPQCKGDI